MISNESFSSFYLFKEHKELFCSRPKKSYLQYKNFRLDLLSGQRLELGYEHFFEEMSHITVDQYFHRPVVVHLFFELGFLCHELEKLVDDKRPLALFVEYQKAQKKQIYASTEEQSIKFENVSSSAFENYHQKFKTIYQHLVDGNCYQVNLTFPFYFKMEQDLTPREFLHLMWKDTFKVGAYAHGTYSHALDTAYLSNSPECLFQIKKDGEKYKVLSLPIKGTLPVKNENEREKKWLELQSSQKNQAELYMIADLVCNDLAKLTRNPARVIHKKFPLNVPGLIHQFAVIESEIDKKKNVEQLIRALFPGGSITGAPKKRVLEITKAVEDYDRGFYCGSTLLLYQDIKTASINIRSAEINFSNNELKYGAGGGITLQSQAKEEYEEMLEKLKSFMLVFKK